MDADGINLVRVTTDDRIRQLWAAATPRGQAVDRVLDAVPEGWCAFLLDVSIEPWMNPGLSNMSYGEVRELTGAKPGVAEQQGQANKIASLGID